MNSRPSQRADDHSERKANAGWNGQPPEWVLVLARACDEAGSQNKVAKRIGKSAAAISRVLAGDYRGSLEAVERAVKDHLMNRRVFCPGLGQYIPVSECLSWQSKPFAPTNPRRVAMFRACRSGCEHSRLEEADHASN